MVQRCRVKLHKFEVRNAGANSIAHRNPVTGGNVGVARVAIDFSRSTRCQHGRFSDECLDDARAIVEGVTAEAPLRAVELGKTEQVDGNVILKKLDVRVAPHGLEEGPRDLGTSRVAVVDYTAPRVPPLTPQSKTRCRRCGGRWRVLGERIIRCRRDRIVRRNVRRDRLPASGRVPAARRTTSEWHNPAPTRSVSATCCSTESSEANTAEIPPCAQLVFDDSFAPFVRIVTVPRSATSSAKYKPASPEPKTM